MDHFTKTLRITQVITLALAGGMVVVMAVVMFMLLNVQPAGFLAGKGPQVGGFPLITLVLCSAGVFLLAVSFILPAIITKAQVTQWAKTAVPATGELKDWETNDVAWMEKVDAPSLNRLLMIFQIEKVILAGVCEAAGVLCAVAYLMETQWIAIVLLVLAIASMVGRLATKGSLNQWLYEQFARLQRG